MNGNRIHEESFLVSFDCEAVSSCEQRDGGMTFYTNKWYMNTRFFFGTAKFPPTNLQNRSEFYRKQTDLLGISSDTQQVTADMRISCFSYSQPLPAEPLQQITDTK